MAILHLYVLNGPYLVGDTFQVLTLVDDVVEPTRALAVGLERRELGRWRLEVGGDNLIVRV